MKLGVIADCFKKPICESISLAGKMGFDGIQIYATSGEFSPDCLEKFDDIKRELKINNLEVSALCADMGGYGFEIEKDNPVRIQKTKRIIDLAEKIGTSVITSHIGVIPQDINNPRYSVMVNALRECSKYAYLKHITVAIETGPEKAKTLYRFLNDVGNGIGVNLDPANFVMVTDQDPVEAVKILKDYVVHTHAKDGKMLIKTDPEIIYNCFAVGGIESLNVADYFIETPLGEGNVNFDKYIKELKNIGYDGYLTIERETGDNPLSDIEKAKKMLEKVI